LGDCLRAARLIPEAHVAYLVAGLEPGSPEAMPRAFHLIGVAMNDPNVASFRYATKLLHR
jgi:hypothetical protein